MLLGALACACAKKVDSAAPVPSGSGSGRGTIKPPVAPPVPRQGMVFIPSGALVVGTPQGAYPRLADEEVPGEQVIVGGFYIDVFPYPNEEGAIPLTNVTQPDAQKLCADRGKRLCHELEWERACKGPDNHLYESGDRYRSDACGTGTAPLLRPSGLRVGCRSDYGVRDLHGGAFEWTASPFRRGTTGDLVALRGGNSAAGELVGRCANAVSRAPDASAATVSFRCCAGSASVPDVELSVRHPRKLEARDRLDPVLVPELLKVLPDSARASLLRHGALEPDRMWSWWPAGNDELTVLSVCAGTGRRAFCGILVSRVTLGKPTPLVWADGGTWQPMLHAENDPRDLWLLGGDEPGAFRRRLSYQWGEVSAGKREKRPVNLKQERGTPKRR
ncbi:MAG TPA: SUMF1/EgtB/PvdO family nonheme iron enzyme [Polyangiaceae bacterium]|nr:SUMF1/EgtB/PvdO family nonheme iron enzyme [Polyangiaceae bacterium]